MPTGAAPPAIGASSPAHRILVVDDEEEILELIGEYLTARDHETVTAYDGAEALQLLRSEPFDIVITDLKMPQLGGLGLIEATAELRRPVAVIVMTAFPTVDSALQAMKAGAYDYLRKPFRLRALHDAIVDAAARLDAARESRRATNRTRLFEASWDIRSPEGLPRFYGLLTTVARDDCAADEVALWLREPTGWTAVARGGQVRRLANTEPASVGDTVVVGGSLAAVPLWSLEGKRVGTLAVAGGETRTAAHEQVLERLGRMAGAVVGRLLPFD